MENETLPRRIKSLREKSGWFQKDVADKLNVKSNTLSGYENGTRSPDPHMLIKIAELYGVSVDYLLGRAENPKLKNKVTVAGQEISLSAEEAQLFNELKKHPVLFHDLASDPENKVKELIKLYKMKKIFFDDDEAEEYHDGFGELED